MFTGIIDHYGTLEKIETLAQGLRFWIASHFTDLQLGESMAVDGICLTVADIKENLFSVEISPETLAITTVRFMQSGQLLNLERALQMSSRLGGHFVTGHVDQVATVESIHKMNEFVEIKLCDFNKPAMKLMIEKGSIAVNGVSLTINKVTESSISLMLIPHTLERTNLHLLQTGSSVNIEFDMIAKLVAKQTNVMPVQPDIQK